jgi:glycosyltransferase involved in cell wall biosynthesis
MRILMALTYYYPHWTGLTAFAQRIAEGLVARGHQVTVLTSQYQPYLPREDAHHGVRIVRLPIIMRLSRGQVMPSFPFALWQLLGQHDVVQVHTPMLEPWIVGVLAHARGRKMLMTHHGDLVMPAGALNQLVQRGVGWMLNRGAATADVISMYTEDYARHSAFLRPYLHKLAYIFPPVTFPRAESQKVEAWRQELGLVGHPVVGFAGRFVEEKGFDYLFKAIPAIIAEAPDVRFVFAGETNVVYESFWQRCQPLLEPYRDRVVLLGLLTAPEEMARFYALCDLFVLPSRTDCLASVQVEAMFNGTPVVATDIPGAREVVRRSGMGLLVEPRDEQALARGIVEVLRNRSAYVRPFAEVHERFDPQRAISEYEQLFADLIASRR